MTTSVSNHLPPAPTQAPARILLVDDEPANLLALEAVLAQPGRELVRATSGEAALRELLRDEFAVVVLDVHLAGIDGFETATLMRQRDSLRATPIIFLTASGDSVEAASRSYAVGAVDYLSKPFNAAVLEAKVAVFVELYRKRKEVEQHAAAMARLAHLEGVLLAARTFEHELNTRLTTTIGYATMLSQDPTLPADLTRRAEQCLVGAQEIARIIRRLLELTEDGTLPITDWRDQGTTIDVRHSA